MIINDGDYLFLFQIGEHHQSKGNNIVFYKSSHEPITKQNYRSNICMSSMSNAVQGLYHGVQKVRGYKCSIRNHRFDSSWVQLFWFFHTVVIQINIGSL